MPIATKRTEVTNPAALAEILDILDDHATGVRRVFNVSIDDRNIFRGNAEIPQTKQYLAFKLDPESGRIAYKGVEEPRSDSWREDAAATKRSGKKLNCKNGNIQCGGKCQGAALNCFAGMTPAQKKAAQKAAAIAKKESDLSLPAPTEIEKKTRKTSVKQKRELPEGVTSKTYGDTTSYVFKLPSGGVELSVYGDGVKSGWISVTDLEGRGMNFNDRDGAIVARKMRQVLEFDVSQRSNGYQYKAASTFGKREKKYQLTRMLERAGFSRPQAALEGVDQFAIVKGGKLVPDTKRLKEVEGERYKFNNERWTAKQQDQDAARKLAVIKANLQADQAKRKRTLPKFQGDRADYKAVISHGKQISDRHIKKNNTAEHEKLRQAILKQHSVSPDVTQKIVDQTRMPAFQDKRSQASKTRFENDLKDFYSLTNIGGSSQLREVVLVNDRAHYNAGLKALNVGMAPRFSPEASKQITFHELGHAWEYSDSKIKDAAIAWRDSRATSKKEEKLSKLTGNKAYEDRETALPDKYIDPYVGKVYGTKATEVVSMGIERFTSAANMRSFYKQDPDHFHLIVGLLTSEN